MEATAAAPPESPVLFLLVNELRAAVEDLSAAGVQQACAPPKKDPRATGADTDGSPPARALSIFHGSQVVQQKSTFQAHVAQVHSRTDVADALAQLYADSHIARATHNMC